jgi:aryl-alcohol dehydrogenase-like predicted oxidoreductase
VTAALSIERVALGGTGDTIARIALGCGNFGGVGSAPEFFGQGLSEAEALAVMDAAWEAGLSHFDTADAYGGGRSERAIGRWIASRGVRPTLTTKTFNPMAAGADQGLAPERIERQLSDSLERLGVEQVELYLAHDFDPEVPLSESLASFGALRAAGRVRAYGVSNFDAGQLEQALAGGDPAAVQNSFSLLERGDQEDLLPLCEARGITYLAFSPLAGGWLTGKYRRGEPYPDGSRMAQRPGPYAKLTNEQTYTALEALEAFAAQRGISMAGAALAWLLADPRVGQIVVGPGRPEHLAPVGEALAAPLSPTERQRVQSLMTQ